MPTPLITQPAYQDGDYSTPVPISRAPREYPFAYLGDIYTSRYTRSYEVDLASFAPRFGVRTSFTNTAIHSDLTSGWTATRSSLSTSTVQAPDGVGFFQNLIEDTTASDSHYVSQSLPSPPSSVTFTLSVFCKASTRGKLQLFAGASTLANKAYANFDLQDGSSTIGTSGTGWTAISATAQKQPDGSLRLIFTFATPVASTLKVGFALGTTSYSYTGDGASCLLIWGAQAASYSSVPGPYIATTDTARTVSAPDYDDDPLDGDALAYLVAESKPAIDRGRIATFTRTFARLPGTQTDQSRTIMVTKPSPGSDSYPANIGSYLVTKPDANLSLYDAYFRQSVTADSGIPAAVTGGTYTVTFGANTTSSQAYNASASTLQSALNALASVAAYGSVAVTGSYTAGFSVTWAAYSSIGFGLGSMTPSSYMAGIESFISSTSRAVVIRATTPTLAASIDLGGITASPKSGTITGSGTSGVYTVGISAGSTMLYDFFNLTVETYTTTAIPCSASTAQVETILNALYPGANFSVYSSGTSKYGYIYSEGGMAVNFKFVHNQVITGGTYTLTVLGQTTASIAYNASLSTIASSINALSNVTARGGVTITGTGFASGIISFTLTYASIPAFTASSASLTPSPATIAIASQSSGFVQSLVFSTLITYRLLAIPNHGLSGNEYLYAKAGSNYYYGFSWNLIGPDQITVDPFSSPFNSATLATEIGARTKQNYSPGTAPVRCTLETRFSLTAIEPAAYQGDTPAFLAAIFAGTGTINYRVGDATRWPADASPLLSLSTTQIDASLL